MKKEQPIKKTVTIIYGNNEIKKNRVKERILENKVFQKFKEHELDEDGLLVISNCTANIFYTKCSDIAAFEPLISHNEEGPNYQANIFSQDATGKLTEISNPELIFEIESLTPADIAYFSSMEHVQLYACII